MKKIKYIFVIFISLCTSSCKFFQNEEKEGVVARAADSYLYQEDIEDVVPLGITGADSIALVRIYMNDWARQQLLIEKAKVNLPVERQEELNRLVEQYENDIFTEVYKEALVTSSIDTIIQQQEIDTFYQANKQNFKLNEKLLKLRYIKVSKNHYDLGEVTKRFRRFNNKDKIHLDSIALQFRAYWINDSLWVKADQVYGRIPLLTEKARAQYLKKSQFFTLEDSLEVYLVQVNELLERNEIAPLAYVKPTVKQIILNKRKLEFIRKLEKDIIDDAVNKKQYEIYE